MIQRMVGMIGERGMIDLFYKRMIDEVIENFLGVLRMAFKSERKRLGALQEQESGKGRDRSSGISEQDRADIYRESGFTCGVGEFYAVIAGVGLGNPRISARGSPVKCAAVYDNAAEGVPKVLSITSGKP